MSSGRLGPAREAPSCWRRRNDASPPGPDSSATAWPMIARSSASRDGEDGPPAGWGPAAEPRIAPPPRPLVYFDKHRQRGSLSVRRAFAGKHIMLVGVTGFIGKVWL